MIYSSRLKKILMYCLHHRDICVNLDDLANLLNISRRTVFRELKNIDQELESYELKLVNQSGKGISIEGSEEKKDELYQELQFEGVDYIDKEERRQLLMFELLRSNSITKLLHYAHMFQVSQATISNDLDSMKDWFHQYQLKLIRKPGLGVEVSGDEQNMRFAMTQLLHQTLTKNAQGDVNYLDSQTLLHEIFMNEEHNSIMRLLNQEILERILNVFSTYQHELALDRYAQVSYIGLIIHLVIAIERILKKEEIADNEQVLAMIREDVSFLQAEKMAQYLELEFDIDIPETEIAFIALHIKGAKITSSDRVANGQSVWKMHALIHDVLSSYPEDVRFQLLQDEELIHGLTTHLEPAIIRLKNHLPIYNPLLSQIKEMYQALFEQTKKACHCIEEVYACNVSEDEIGFITMHVGASLERRKQQRKQLREILIGVVCASGIGVSALLCARIVKAFPYGVHVKTLSMEELLNKDYKACELLVSTFPLESEDIQCIQVSALLNTEDIAHLKQEIEDLRKRDVMVEEHEEYEFHEQLKRIKDCCGCIEDILQHVGITTIPSNITKAELFERIGDAYGQDELTKQALIQALWRREELGTVVLLDEGFAMFHARCKGLKHSCFHLYYPQGARYTKETLHGLQFLVVLLGDEGQDTDMQRLLSSLSRALIEQESFLTAIQSRDENMIYTKLNELLKKELMDILEETL